MIFDVESCVSSTIFVSSCLIQRTLRRASDTTQCCDGALMAFCRSDSFVDQNRGYRMLQLASACVLQRPLTHRSDSRIWFLASVAHAALQLSVRRAQRDSSFGTNVTMTLCIRCMNACMHSCLTCRTSLQQWQPRTTAAVVYVKREVLLYNVGLYRPYHFGRRCRGPKLSLGYRLVHVAFCFPFLSEHLRTQLSSADLKTTIGVIT